MPSIEQKSVNDEASSGGYIPLPSNSTEGAIISFGLTLNFIKSWLKSFKIYYYIWTEIFYEEMLELFQKIPITLPRPVY